MSDNEHGVTDEFDTIPGDWADVYAYVTDSRYTRVWCVHRTSEYEVAVSAFDCKPELADRDGSYGKKYFEVEPETDTEEWAQEYAKNHQDAIELTRARFNADD